MAKRPLGEILSYGVVASILGLGAWGLIDNARSIASNAASTWNATPQAELVANKTPTEKPAATAPAKPALEKSDPPWPGARWPGARNKTRLDHVFTADAAGRQALFGGMADIAVAASIAWRCNGRSLDWAINVDRHLAEIAEDPTAHLNDPRSRDQLRAALKNMIDKAGDGFENRTGQDRFAICQAVRFSPEFKEADEISLRGFLRHHDEWEGAGGD